MLNHLSHIPIVIVGAGPTGLTLACCLAKRKVPFLILDKKPGLSQITKAIGIQPRTIEYFQFMGIEQKLLDQSIITQHTNMFVGTKRLAQTNYQVIQTPFPYLLSIPQFTTEQILYDHLQNLGGTILFNHELSHFEVQKDKIHLTINNTQSNNSSYQISSQYLISCEGARSSIRKQLQIPFFGLTYKTPFLFADVDIDWSLSRQEMYGWFHKDGLLATAAMPNTSNWKLFADMGSQNLNRKDLNLALLQKLIHKRTGLKEVKVHNLTWIDYFTVNHRMVNRYRAGNIFLAGDAAHIHSPLGGQGMNMGIQDAFNLAWKLAKVYKKESPPNLLDTYETERLPIAKQILQRTHFSTKILTSQYRLLQFFRDQMMTRILGLKMVQKRWLPVTSQLKLDYRKSTLSKNQLSFSKQLLSRIKAGDRLPSGTLVSPNQQAVSIYKCLEGGEFILLILCSTNTKLPNDLSVFHHPSISPILISKTSQISPPINPNDHPIYTTPDLFQKLHLPNGGLCLIRPDGYIAYYSDQLDGSAYQAFLSQNYFIKPI